MREERDLPNDIPDDKKSPDTKTSDSGILRSEIRGRTELATCPSSSKFSSEFGSALERVIETGGRFKRLWLIRHFDYEDSPEANAYRKASERDKSLMSQSEIDSLNEIGKNVRANVDDPQIQRALRAAFRKRPDGTKMVLFSDFDESIMVRNRMTMEWVERDPSTRGSFVSERTKLSVPKMSDGGKKTYDAFIQTKTVIGTWGKGTEDGTMLGNRTFAHPFGLRIGRPCDTEKDATARLERDGYDFWDVEKGESGKPIIPDGKTLRITPDNAP